MRPDSVILATADTTKATVLAVVLGKASSMVKLAAMAGAAAVRDGAASVRDGAALELLRVALELLQPARFVAEVGHSLVDRVHPLA